MPFVQSVSCQPLEMKGPDVPPTFSGLPSDDRPQWGDFRAEYDRAHRDMWRAFDEWMQSVGAPPLPDLEFVHDGDLNLYLYPEVADYTDRRPLGPNWHRLDQLGARHRRAVRGARQLRTDDPTSKLVYLSLGSLGSADVGLMRRLVDVLGRTRHRYIVSKGPLADEYELPSNMWGEAQVPQTNVLPLVDLVITHGGNNTTTEAFHFGKPMVVMPLFWDQYDNAQRVHELGFGRRLDTYGFDDDELIGAVDRLLADEALHRRMAANGEVIRGRKGTRRAPTSSRRLAR